MGPDSRHDAVIVGGGHNGLVAAAYLARAGRSVLVLERRDHVGGAAVSERPWPGVDARLSRYAYLVSLLPRTIVEELGLPIELRRRRIAFHAPGAPVPGDGWERLSATCRTVAQAVFPSLTEPLLSADDLRARIGDDAAWSALFERPIGELIEECLDDDTLRGVALTDALIGTFAGAHDADLRQNRCFLYHVLSTWDVPIGGMGVVTDALRDAAVAAGAELRCGAEATAVEPGAVRFADAAGGERVATAEHVLANVAPAVLDRLRGSSPDTAPEGAQLKVNFLLSRLPRLRDPAVSPEDAFAGTFHVNEGYAQLEAARGRAAAGELPEPIPCEVYCHSLTDPSILGPELRDAGAQTLTCFALQLPARLFAGDPDGTRDRALEATLASLDSVLGEPILDCAWVDPEGRPCIEARTPSDLESELGLPGGNIFHRDLSWPFAEREEEVGTWGVETDDPGLLLCGAGARRGGGVSGVPGRNAAQAVLRSGA
ncbi:MAG TPA: NAD(P)/FAD-dependent oxidoreductase [Solirubrobacteraceae bacterium]|nr:NAD(P)/FAD-dependent oxidoreductase [Solirubrobacteraceae bacterium]